MRDLYVWIALFVAISFGAVGLTDDLLKLKRGRGQGISGRSETRMVVFVRLRRRVVSVRPMHFDTHLTIPFAKNLHPDLHWWGYIPFAIFVIVGSSHAVNLTDGLDGLAIGPVMTVALTYWVFTYVAGNLKFATYLAVPHIPGIRRGRDFLRRAGRRFAGIFVVQCVSGLDDDG